MENKKLNFELTVDEINAVLNALAKQPFEQVFKLINELQQSASAQLQPAPEAEVK